MQDGKVVKHRCGYALRSQVGTQFGDTVVVNFRDVASGVVVFQCPGCGKPLQIWWEALGQCIGASVVVDVDEFGQVVTRRC